MTDQEDIEAAYAEAKHALDELREGSDWWDTVGTGTKPSEHFPKKMTCQQCSKIFYARKNSKRKYCSGTCSNLAVSQIVTALWERHRRKYLRARDHTASRRTTRS